MADTRKDRRAPVSLKVRFKSATVDEFIEHYCKDVSRGGIFIKSSQPMAIGTLLKFQFQLKDESSLIKGVGRVVWTRSPEDAVADQPAGMGIKFIKMDNESRAIVDRIVDSHGDDSGAFDEGRATATQTEKPSERPRAASESFFPDTEPAELPPPEDRTAVRQAAQFLAAALAEGGTDQAAAREAEHSAHEARQRTAQIEAQRQAAAAGGSGPSPLPSMIVDPTLGAREGKPLTVPPATERDSSPTTTLPPPASFDLPPAPRISAPPTASASLPPPAPLPARLSAEPPTKKSPLIPAAILVGILAVAAWAYQRRPSEVEPSVAPTIEPAKIEPAAKAPEPEPAEPPPAVAPTEAEDAAAAEAVPAEPAPEVKLVDVDVKAVPAGADVLLGGELKGQAPLKLPLPEGVVSLVTVRAAGYSESSQQVDPAASPKKVLRFALLPLPYRVRVDTTPPGAKIFVGAKTGKAGEEIDLGAVKGQLAITARLAGYEVLRAPLKLDAFTQTADAMRASVSLTLVPLPVAPVAPPKPVRVRPVADAATPAPAAAPEAPAPSPSPEPAAPASGQGNAMPRPSRNGKPSARAVPLAYRSLENSTT
jgi:uncharacterized protein (TIGR02266 family)